MDSTPTLEAAPPPVVAPPENTAAPDVSAPPGVPTVAGSIVPIDEVDAPSVTLSRQLPIYSLQARVLRIQGTVTLRILINERGTVDDVVVVSGVEGADLNDSAVKAARHWTYQPATKRGVPVSVWKVESLAFKL